LEERVAMSGSGQVTVALEGELERFVAEEADRQGFASSGEYVESLLRERLVRTRLEALDVALARGLADAEAGRVIPIEAAFERLERELSG
jgi:antitoxin ParD1/3/4